MSNNDNIFIQMSDISHLAIYLQATEKQMLASYGRALGRTSIWLKARASRTAKDGIGFRELKTLQKRMWYYRKRAAAGKLDSLNFWLGLNAVPVSQLKGKIKGRGGKRHARRDKRTGRFIKRRKGSAAPTFSPASASLPETTFEDGFVTKPAGGRRTILVRGKYRTREATIDIYDPTNDAISPLVRELQARFMKTYEQDLKHRVSTNLRTDGNGRRI